MQKHNNDSLPAIEFPSAIFFGSESRLSRIKDNIVINTNEHMYLPKHSDFNYDWVKRVAIPAFRAFCNKSSNTMNFCTIGTGSGTDALAAIEILNPSKVLVTDIHKDVVELAVKNITNNLNVTCTTKVHGGIGLLAKPVQEDGDLYDLIYENLPNIPLNTNDAKLDGILSSTFYNPSKKVPDIVKRNLLELHQRFLIDCFSKSLYSVFVFQSN